MNAPQPSTEPPLLLGMSAIMTYLGLPARAGYRIVERRFDKASRLPIWKLGDRWCADPRDLDAWRDLQRTKARGKPPE